MSGAVTDLRDVLGIDTVSGEPRQPPLKKQRTIERRPEGITRELYALLGENAAPVAVTEHRFKDKPKFLGTVAAWKEQDFRNSGRTDDLELKHWVRQSSDNDESQMQYQFARFNIKVDVLEYTDSEYDSVLKEDDWSREETDYLFSLIRENDLRWIIVADRYEWRGKDRSMEDLKARYYTVCKSVLEWRTPVTSMSSEQMTLFNAMHYNKEQEVERKRILEKQLLRTPAEVEQEQHLVTELRRIYDSHQNLLAERNELFDKLDYPKSEGSIAAYLGSAGLTALVQKMQEGTKKRKSIAVPTNGPAQEDSKAASTSSPAISRRESIAEPPRASGHQRTESAASTINTPTQKDKKQAVVKTLTKAEEAQYNLSHHEKLQPGAFFRSTKINLPKGQAFINKSPAIFAELGIPPNLTMPTLTTCTKYETLCKEIAQLMDLRKQIEKVEQETKTFKAQENLTESKLNKRSASVMSDSSRSSKRVKKEK